MPKINIMYELEQTYLTDETPYYKIKIDNNKEKNVKVSDKVFDMMLDEGLLRKTNDGYVFVGKYEDLPGKKKKKIPS
ncbi:hypothetical protein AYK25_06875 [Thermoplasmatales archaeon SM1-50]|nr:MAG: hypothetical protein AYK25_06875 [Thermoplasmatales archaeon SM1-50]